MQDFDIVSSPDKRSGVEERWASLQPYLLTKGYRLRPRYQPDWVPSWRNTDLRPTDCEDSIDSIPIRVLDATRTQDGQQVIIKMVIPSQKSSEGKDEVAVLQYFSNPPLKDNPSNHVVPCLDTFPIPGEAGGHFIVMPLLGQFDEPAFHNLAEVHEFLQQIFEGLLFMHRYNVAHCDIAAPNIMMDARPLYDEPFHPVYHTVSLDTQRMIYPQYRRSQKNTRYYFIDLGYAKWFKDPASPRLTTGREARERAPEQKHGQPYDPFLVDIYQLGIVLRQHLIPQIERLRFLDSLATSMTRTDPATRIPLDQAQRTMNTAFAGVSGWRYRYPIMPRESNFQVRVIYMVWGVASEIRYWIDHILSLFGRRVQ